MASFDDIIGHTKERGALLADIAHGNVTHAYLFSGAPHLGKMAVAKWFARELLTDHLPAEARPPVKEQIDRFIHPNFLCLDDLWIEDVNDDWNKLALSSNVPQQHRSKAPVAKTDTISIEDVRALTDRLHETSDSPHFCCIVRGMERMQPAAANALLKILEEPPSRVVFILTTDQPNALLPTIISRTRMVRFSPLRRTELLPILEGRDDDDAAFALHVSQGAPGKLISLLSDAEALRATKQLHSQAKRFWQATTLKERLEWLMQAGDDKQGTDELLLHLSLTLREQPDLPSIPMRSQALHELVKNLKTNAHRGLLLERFALAVG